MTDKTRQLHRHVRAPHGHLPNWVVAAVAVGLCSLAVLVQRLA